MPDVGIELNSQVTNIIIALVKCLLKLKQSVDHEFNPYNKPCDGPLDLTLITLSNLQIASRKGVNVKSKNGPSNYLTWGWNSQKPS